MKLRRSLRKLERRVQEVAGHATDSHRVLWRNIGWISAGAAVLTVGLVVGRELRGRYKFNRRTPYDFYAHAGDTAPDIEFGVGT